MINNRVHKDKHDKTSIESLVLGILALLSSIAFFLLIPRKPFGINIIQPIDALEEFSKFTFFLFLILLLCVIAIGSSIVAIIFGIKDFRGIFRGAYISSGKNIYLVGAVLGALSIIFIIGFFIVLLAYSQ